LSIKSRINRKVAAAVEKALELEPGKTFSDRRGIQKSATRSCQPDGQRIQAVNHLPPPKASENVVESKPMVATDQPTKARTEKEGEFWLWDIPLLLCSSSSLVQLQHVSQVELGRGIAPLG